MSSPFSGGCLCGAIRFECHGSPIAAVFCHCRNCQKAHAAPFAALVLVPPGSIELVAGEPKRHHMVADSGAAIFREFCGQCGTHLFSGGAAFPQFKSLMIVVLDDPAAISPVAHVWTVRAPVKFSPGAPVRFSPSDCDRNPGFFYFRSASIYFDLLLSGCCVQPSSTDGCRLLSISPNSSI